MVNILYITFSFECAQVEELKLKDEYEEVCIPQGGYQDCPDPIGRRTGKGWLVYYYKYDY